ncbi:MULTISPECIES: hypothetical protein [unclassified Brevibacterium]|uniref:hypothetical protein n=1 Tax=unclassified Brevibacterium TaxID=2614124 RepID=UPI001867F158|nr:MULTISPECIES: hypothetical protein [unclassified Brevibacterium]
MKRLALAAAFALAVSTVGVGPAAAESLTTAEALAAQARVEAPTEAAADPGDGADPGTGEGQDASETDPDRDQDGGESTGPGESTTAGEEASDPEDSEDEENEDDAAKPQAIEANFVLDKKKMTAEEIGDPDKGIGYTIEPLEVGDVVTAEPGEAGSTTVEAGGAFTGTILGNTEVKAGETLDVSVTVTRDGEDPKTFSGSVQVVAPEDDDGDGDLTVSPKTQSLGDFASGGVRIALDNCTIGGEVNFRITRKGDSDTTLWEDTQKADENSTGSTTFVPDSSEDGWIGDFVVEATCGDKSTKSAFTVTDEGGEDSDADLTVTPKSQELQEFLNDGVYITLVNCRVDDDVKFRVSTKNDPDTTIWEETQKAGEDAAGFVNFVPQGERGASWADEFLVMASCGDKTAETTFTVTDDGSVIDPKLSIDPEKISGEDFINGDKGVTITVTDCEPGSDAKFEVWGFEPSEKLYDQSAEVAKNGAASVHVYGLGNSSEVYVGAYQVKVNCMDQGLNGGFVVTGASDGGGSGDSGNAGSMPRTGAELTGLGAGAVLILGGAATILFARRRAQVGR